MSFVRRVVKAYTKTEAVDTSCGYACSDHMSVSRAEYPSAFVFESVLNHINTYIHTKNDTLAHVPYTHMVEHAKLIVGFVTELAFAEL
jgi:leucyl aminopeptidase